MNPIEFTALALLAGLSYALLLVLLGWALERAVAWLVGERERLPVARVIERGDRVPFQIGD